MAETKRKRKWLSRLSTPLANQLQGQELRTVVFVALSFHAVFTGYRSIQNLQSSLNEEKGLGVISLGVLYGAWIFSGLLTPTVIRFLTTKGALLVAWACHALYTVASFYPSWGLLLPVSILVGVSSAPLWTAQSLYVTACGYSFAKHSQESPYHVFSRFSGIFFAIYETSQITGNLVSSIVLQRGVNDTEWMLFRQCGRGDCPSADNATDFEEPPDRLMDVLLGVYVACNLTGLAVTYFFVLPLPKSEWTSVTSLKDTMTSVFVTLRRSDIALLVPLFIFQGMQQAILYSEYTRSYVSCPLGIHMVGFVMAAHGATTPAVTLALSRLVKWTGRFALFVTAGLVNLGLMVVMYLWTPDKEDEVFIFLVPIAWGISEGTWMTQTNAVIAVQFREEKEAAFAIYHTARSVGLALTFVYSSFLCASVKLLVAIVFVLIGLLSYTAAELYTRWRDRRKAGQASDRNGAVSSLASTVANLSTDLALKGVHSASPSTPLSLVLNSAHLDNSASQPTPSLTVSVVMTSRQFERSISSAPSVASSTVSSLAVIASFAQHDYDDMTSPIDISDNVFEEAVY